MNTSTKPQNWKERVVHDLARELDRMIADDEVTDFSAAAGRATSGAMIAAAHTANRINDRLGAFYTIDRVRQELGGVSRQAVNERVKGRRLLRVETADGKFLFPAFQIADGGVPHRLRDVLKVLLASGADGWTVAYWLTARAEHFGGRTALDLLSTGDEDRIDDVVALAAHDAAGWTSAT